MDHSENTTKHLPFIHFTKHIETRSENEARLSQDLVKLTRPPTSNKTSLPVSSFRQKWQEFPAELLRRPHIDPVTQITHSQLTGQPEAYQT